jgi:hypothetical protein
MWVNLLDILYLQELGVKLNAHQGDDMYHGRMKWHFGFIFLVKVNQDRFGEM